MTAIHTGGRSWRLWRAGWLLAVIGIFAYGAYVRFVLPQWPLIAPDSYAYMLPVVNGGVYNIGPRTFVYPMFCRFVINGAADWRALTLTQHVLGLLGPALLLAGWYLAGVVIWTSRRARVAHEALGLALPLLLVPSGVYVVLEHQMLLESLNAFFQCSLAALLCVLWLPMPPRRRLLLAGVTACLGVFMYSANPRWGAAAPFVVALAVAAAITGRDPGRSWFRAAWPVLVCAIAAYFGLAQVQLRLVTQDPWLGTFTAKHLLWMHADLAVNEWRRDLATTPLPAYADLLHKMIPKVEKEIVGFGTSHWSTLTFNANALLYVEGCPDADLAAYFKGNPDGYTRFCLRYYARIVWHQPVAYFSVVWRMLYYYYGGESGDGAFREIAAPISDSLPAGAPVARYVAGWAVPGQRARLEAAASEMERKVTPPVSFTPPAWLMTTVVRLRFWFPLVTLAGVASAGVIWWQPRLRRRRELALPALLCLVSVSILFLQVLTLAMITVTEGRYSDALRTLAVFSLVCALATVSVLAADRMARPRIARDARKI